MKNGSRKVLVVDDDVSVLSIVLRWLADAGHETVTCQTVESGAVCLQGWQPDVLVTDVRVNGTNGLYLAVLANQRTPRVKAIVVSGFPDEAIAKDAKSQNARFMLKPLSRERLLEAILGPFDQHLH